jgi:O-antigen/teichoic acid export membrane protein
VSCVIVCVYKAIILLTRQDILWFGFSNVLDAIILTIFTIIAYKLSKGQRLSFSLSYGIRMIKQSYFYIISGTLVALTLQIDRILIGQYLSEYEVGLYGAAIYLGTVWGFLLNAIIESNRPVIIEARKNNKEEYEKRLKKLFALIIWGGGAVALIITLFARFGIVLVYGIEFEAAHHSLAILAWSVPLIHLVRARNIWLISEEKNHYDLIFGVIGVVFNVILNIFIIPIYGINGAAITAVITQLLIAVILPLLFKGVRISSLWQIQALLLKGIR